MALDWLKGKFNEVSANLKSEVTKIKNKDLLEGIVAGCTMVAHADGIVKPEEKQKMIGFLRSSDVLSVFDTGDVIELFEKYSHKFDFDYTIGEADALQVIGRLKKKESEARLLVRVCCAIGASDGDFDDKEKNTVRKICTELGLHPADFDL
ncbi:tellurite resistance TerB family protein [Candidatus Nitrosacidococcus tergens]|uniref:Tellurite resistance TerB n=1 Tax=Candidatus Nitrosacidococcus tergens TaxID=553981 RepID=A0A7G1Q987_9GAMM|nr:tellurite resistance TerB family protein [Candidatus Nitrosacidococcus tergens]CAB1275557.1 Tellurite resistance TerB [Candidatus Nitrosacidococcus tergens]